MPHQGIWREPRLPARQRRLMRQKYPLKRHWAARVKCWRVERDIWVSYFKTQRLLVEGFEALFAEPIRQEFTEFPPGGRYVECSNYFAFPGGVGARRSGSIPESKPKSDAFQPSSSQIAAARGRDL